MERFREALEEMDHTAASVATESTAKPTRKLAFVDALDAVLITVLIAVFGTTFVVQAFKIPSESMEPTLLVGDHLLVNKFIFGGRGEWYEKMLPYRRIRHGDIVIFKFPYDDHPDYIKRVIGLPEDRIRIADKQVLVNGNPLIEPYAEYVEPYPSFAGDTLLDRFPPENGDSLAGIRPEWAAKIAEYVRDGELLIPANCYFVLGDNREDSLDSRYWGFVSKDSIIGRPVVIYWSVQADAEDYVDQSVFGAVAGVFQAFPYIPSRTRWQRILREVH